MGGVVPTSANDFIEQQLDQRLEALEQAFDADAFCFVGNLVDGVDDFVRGTVDSIRQLGSKRERLVVFLTTSGGSILVVQRIVDTLRHHYAHVAFVIPNQAFSAGTVLAMSGDEIFMDYYSRLGPIDPQVPNTKGRWVPALGYLAQWERLVAKAERGELTVAEAQLMIYDFDQAELYEFEQARELSVTLLKEWLVQYKFKNWVKTHTSETDVTPEMRQDRAEEIARQLSNTDRWHSHGYGISMAVLRNDLNLLIDDLDDVPERCRSVRQYHGLLSDYLGKLGFPAMLHSVGRVLPLG